MPKLIAIIDDDLEMELLYGLLLEDMLIANEAELKFFSDSRVFELWLRSNNPDLVVSDMSMPHVTGIELGHRIRESGHTMPTYFVSGHDEKDFSASLKNLGSCRYLPKPFDCERLINFMKTDLGLSG